MFFWTPDTIRFRADAAEYSDFDGKIAEQIAARLPSGLSVCDAGCGLGYMSLALAAKGYRMAAVDSSPEALEVLRKNAAAANATNISVSHGDVFAMQPEKKYDAMVFCFFGRTDETLKAVRAQCNGHAFLIKKNWEFHRFTLYEKRLERFTFPITCAELEALGVPYTSTMFPIEMGQPFRSLEDAAHFFSLYNDDGAQVSVEQIAHRLTATGSAKFPWYLPSCLSVGMIMLDTEKIPDL